MTLQYKINNSGDIMRNFYHLGRKSFEEINNCLISDRQKCIEKHYTKGRIVAYNGQDGIRFYIVSKVQSNGTIEAHLICNPTFDVSFRKKVMLCDYYSFPLISKEEYLDFQTELFDDMLSTGNEGLDKLSKVVFRKESYKFLIEYGHTRVSFGKATLSSKVRLHVIPKSFGLEKRDKSFHKKSDFVKIAFIQRECAKSPTGLKNDQVLTVLKYWNSSNIWHSDKWVKSLLGYLPKGYEFIDFDNMTEIIKFLNDKNVDFTEFNQYPTL